MTRGIGGATLSDRQQRLKEKAEIGQLSRTQQRERAKRIAADRAKEATEAAQRQPREERFRATTAVNGETVVAREGGYDQQLSRLEYLRDKGVITPRQCDAGAWLADRWSAYFTPGVSSGIEDHAPGSVPSDPLARWVRGQRTIDIHGKPRTPPPTFRPKRPSADRRGHDGWTYRRCDALQAWIRANRLMQTLGAFDREVVTLVAIEGQSLEEAFKYITNAKSCGGKQRDKIKAALHRGLDAIADETEPMVREIAA